MPAPTFIHFLQERQIAMPSLLPYAATPGSIKTALDKIRSAAVPERVTQDFVQTKLAIKGGTGAAIPPFLKRIGLVASDGKPTDLYREFRNASQGGRAMAEAIKIGYKPLGEVNEYFYELDDNKLLDLIVQVTGAEKTAPSTKLTLSAIKALKTVADFDAAGEPAATAVTVSDPSMINNHPMQAATQRVGLNLSYTINLNLPASTDQAVFNAIFKSLKEHLISDEQE
jgi:hypothetical protein